MIISNIIIILISLVIISGVIVLTYFTVKVWTSSSNPPTSLTPPTSPTIDSIDPSHSQLLVNFTPPVSDGGSAITDYKYSKNNGTTWELANTTSSPILISGLNDGQSYDVVIRAINSVGEGAVSNSVSSTPNYQIDIFNAVGSENWIAPLGVTSVEYLVVAGGGGSGGGYDTGGGGGGGGGMVSSGNETVVPGTTYIITVGDGGVGGISIRGETPVETSGSPGENSSFGSITALGGQGGYGSRMLPNNGEGGAAAITPTTASFGGRGGGSNGGGGGGGGSSGAGGNKLGATGGRSGPGISSSITVGLPVLGIGGRGANGSVTNVSIPGTSNTGNGARGGGAGAGQDENGAKGGSGIVVIKY
jgi:hypothetical protein